MELLKSDKMHQTKFVGFFFLSLLPPVPSATLPSVLYFSVTSIPLGSLLTLTLSKPSRMCSWKIKNSAAGAAKNNKKECINDTKLSSIRPKSEVPQAYWDCFCTVFTGPPFIFNCFICSIFLGSTISLTV